jgi:hypothetical protein
MRVLARSTEPRLTSDCDPGGFAVIPKLHQR